MFQITQKPKRYIAALAASIIFFTSIGTSQLLAIEQSKYDGLITRIIDCSMTYEVLSNILIELDSKRPNLDLEETKRVFESKRFFYSMIIEMVSRILQNNGFTQEKFLMDVDSEMQSEGKSRAQEIMSRENDGLSRVDILNENLDKINRCARGDYEEFDFTK